MSTKYAPTRTGKTSANRLGISTNAAPAARPSARAMKRSLWKSVPWSCHHHHGSSANVSDTADVLTKRAEAGTYLRKASRIAVRHRHGKVVAVIEILSPGNKKPGVLPLA